MLQELQNAMVSLLSQKEQRARFREEPEAWLSSYVLTPEERSALSALSFAQISRYAQGLCNKRWHELAGFVPLTFRAFAPLGTMYQDWLARHPAHAIDTSLPPGLAEGLRALPMLRQALSKDPDAAPFLADLLTFEILQACARIDGQARFLRSLWRIDLLVRAMREGEGASPPEEPTLFRFERHRLRRRALREKALPADEAHESESLAGASDLLSNASEASALGAAHMAPVEKVGP